MDEQRASGLLSVFRRSQQRLPKKRSRFRGVLFYVTYGFSEVVARDVVFILGGSVSFCFQSVGESLEGSVDVRHSIKSLSVGSSIIADGIAEVSRYPTSPSDIIMRHNLRAQEQTSMDSKQDIAAVRVIEADESIPYTEKQRKAHAIYDVKIRPLLAPADEDKYVMIDIVSEDYEIGENRGTLIRVLRERRPDAVMHCIHRHQSYSERFRGPRSLRRSGERA